MYVMINRNFLFFNTRKAFDKRLKAGEIMEKAIVFIKEGSLIYTHGAFFGGENIKHVFLTQDLYDSVEDYDDDAVYFILDDSRRWVLGDTFPATLYGENKPSESTDEPTDEPVDDPIEDPTDEPGEGSVETKWMFDGAFPIILT